MDEKDNTEETKKPNEATDEATQENADTSIDAGIVDDAKNSEEDVNTSEEADSEFNENEGDEFLLGSDDEDPTQKYLFGDDISDEFKRGYKLYNFRRPDKFSKEHLRALQDIHRDFVRQLSMVLTAYLRMDVEIDIISVDQLTYDEFVCSMPPYIQSGVFKLNPLTGEISLGLSPEILTVILDRMLGGPGNGNVAGKELTQIEESLTKKLIDKVIKTLEGSWCSVLPVKSEFISLDNGYHVVPIATSGEIVALISFEIRLGQKNFGLINLCFPYPVLETVLTKLTPQYIYQHTNVVSNEIGRNEILNKIKLAPLELSVILGSTDILVNDVVDLKVDDIVKLNTKTDDELFVLINGKKKFLSTPGVIDNRVCIKVLENYVPKE